MRLPIGYSDFAEVVRNGMQFVDKSLFIKEILDSSAQVSLITRPRRFGKTFNLSMLYHFLAKNTGSQSSKELFDQLKIAKTGENYWKHQAQYPVIFLSFKDIQGFDFETSYETLEITRRNLYQEHSHLLESHLLSQYDKELFQIYFKEEISPAKFSQSLKFLGKCLYQHYGVKAWLLIDEYDTPIHTSYFRGYYEKMIALMKNLLGISLKDNIYLEKAVVTGIMRVSKESLFSGTNNVSIYSLINSKYGEYFGFTEEEVLELLEKMNASHLINNIRYWYNGYQAGNVTIYNPWSIVNCLVNQGEIKTYWANTSDNAFLKYLLARSSSALKKELETLLQKESISASVEENIVFGDLDKNPSILWSFLVSCGYLKIIHAQSKDTIMQCELAIPNQEIYALYQKLVKDWLCESFGYEEYLNFILSLVQNRIEDFSQYLQKYLWATASVFDIGGNEPEKFYHGLVLGLIVSLMETHEVQSNRESGFGRYDVMLIPKDIEQWGIVLEFKTVRDEQADLKQSAVKALEQINQRQYELALKQKGITRIAKIGIAFRGKQLEVYSESVEVKYPHDITHVSRPIRSPG